MQRNNFLTTYGVWIVGGIGLLFAMVSGFYISQLHNTTNTPQPEQEQEKQTSPDICTDTNDSQNCMLASGTGLNNTNSDTQKNILGTELEPCSTDPMTGFGRDGYCKTGPSDPANHSVCATVTDEFLQYTLRKGNDLITPSPRYNFPGLKTGDRRCLCAARRYEAYQDGVITNIITGATNISTRDDVPRSILQK